MRKNLKKAAGAHYGKPIWLSAEMKPPKSSATY